MMKISAEKEKLLFGLQKVQNIINVRSTLPILSNVLLEVQGSKLKLTATDLDIGISCVVPVDSQETGAITLPAKRFYDIVKELPAGKINITVKKNNLVLIENNSCQFKIMGIGKEEFPRPPEFKDKEAFLLEQSTLKELLNLTSFAVSADETRYILNGILFKLMPNKLTLVATDGKRLAIAEKEGVAKSTKEIEVVIPIKTIHELMRNLSDEGEVSVVLSENQVMFDLKEAVIISRLIEGEFPDYQQVIPSGWDNKLVINREQFLLAIKRASLLSTLDHPEVKLELFSGKVIVSKSTPDLGESWEEVPCSFTGKEMVISFNYSFLLDVLKNLNLEKIELELKDNESPGVIRTKGYIYLVLPMRIG